VPGCSGDGVSGNDYCAARPTDTTLFLRGNNGSPSSNFPLSNCEGDCDTDGECETGLICQQRSGGEAVAGCDGFDPSDNDYCRYENPPTKNPTSQPTDQVRNVYQ